MIYYHYAELVHRQAEKYGSRTALKYRDNATGKWLKISWKEFSEKVMLTAKAMAEFGGKERSVGHCGVLHRHAGDSAARGRQFQNQHRRHKRRRKQPECSPGLRHRKV